MNKWHYIVEFWKDGEERTPTGCMTKLQAEKCKNGLEAKGCNAVVVDINEGWEEAGRLVQ